MNTSQERMKKNSVNYWNADRKKNKPTFPIMLPTSCEEKTGVHTFTTEGNSFNCDDMLLLHH